jgi:hypothetical protein
MNIGDYWEYRDEDFPTPTLHYYVKAKRDTVMSNGHTYRVFNEVEFRFPADSNRYNYYYRVDDSLRVYEYTSLIGERPAREYLRYRLPANDRSIWPVCFDRIPGPQQEYLGILSTQQDSFPHLQLDTLSKLFTSATIDPNSGDTLWNSGFAYGYTKDWLAKGLGLARIQGEAGPLVFLVGAIINGRRYGTITNVDENGRGASRPIDFYLHQNFPNPFNPITSIRYDIPFTSKVSIKVYNMLGEEVATLIDALHNAGSYSVQFNAGIFASGVYFYRMRSNQTVLTNRMVLIK